MHTPFLARGRGGLRSRLRPLPFAVVGAVALTSCTTLDPIPERECGNHVWEEELGEDCDGVAEGATYGCGEPGTDHACKFIHTDGTDSFPCPSDYPIESADGRCRAPSGLFGQVSSFPLLGEEPRLGDFDADGTQEVGMFLPNIGDAAAGGLYTITSIDGAGALVASFPVPSAAAVLADVTADARTDLVFGTPPGFSVLHNPDDDFRLKLYTDEIPERFVASLVGFTAVPTWLEAGAADIFGLSLLGVIAKSAGSEVGLCVLDDQCINFPGYPGDVPLFLAESPEHWLTTWPGRSSLDYVPLSGYGSSFPPSASERRQLSLSKGHRVLASPLLVDADDDDDDDLLVLTDSDTSVQIEILPGNVEPSGFFSWANGATLSSALTGLPDDFDGQWAAGDVNGDGVVDFAIGETVFISRADFPAAAQDVSVGYFALPWARSGPLVSGDVNADGLTDFVSVVDGRAQVLLGGDLLPLITFDLDGVGSVSRLGVVDFDGDGADDLYAALSTSKEPVDQTRSCGVTDNLAVAYGQSGGFPEAFASVADVPPIDQLVTARFASKDDAQNGFGDVLVATRCSAAEGGDEVETVLLQGNAPRTLVAPYRLRVGTDSTFEVSSVGALGSAQGDGTTSVGNAEIVVLGAVLDQPARGFVLPTSGEADVQGDLRAELVLPDEYSAGSPVKVASSSDALAVVAVAEPDGGSELSVGLVLQTRGESDFTETARVSEPIERPEGATGGPKLSLAVTELNGDQVDDFVVLVRFGAGPAISETCGYGPEMGDPSLPWLAGPRVAGVLIAFVSDDEAESKYVAHPIENASECELPFELVTVNGELLIVTNQSFYRLSNEGTALEPTGFATWLDGIGAAAADFNGDGLDDIVLVDGTLGYVFEQLPFTPGTPVASGDRVSSGLD